MIDPIKLPYFPRHGLLKEVFQIFTSGLKQGVTLFAPRRHGKTSFVVNELLPAARERGWKTLYVDLWERQSEPELALVEALEEAVELRSKGWRRRWRLSEFRSKATLALGGLESTHVPVRHVRENVLENRLNLALTALASKGVTLLVLDEVQALAGIKREDFVAALRTVIQKCQGHLVVFYTGSSRDGLARMFGRHRAPLFASAMPVNLPELGQEFVDDRLAFVTERSAAPVSRDEFTQAFERLGRTPEFLNDLVLRLILASDADIEKALVGWVTPLISGGAALATHQ